MKHKQFSPLACKGIGIRGFKFVAKTQLFSLLPCDRPIIVLTLHINILKKVILNNTQKPCFILRLQSEVGSILSNYLRYFQICILGLMKGVERIRTKPIMFRVPGTSKPCSPSYQNYPDEWKPELCDTICGMCDIESPKRIFISFKPS